MIMPYISLGMHALGLLKEFPSIADLPLATSVREELQPIADGKLPQDILLYGRNGVGKTTLAWLLPCWFHISRGEDPALHFLNATTDLDVKTIDDRACLCVPNSDYGWIVLDELDKVDVKRKQQPLLSLIGKYDHRCFIVTANRLADLDPGILSRCQCVEVVPPGIDDLLLYAQRRLRAAGKTYDDNFLRKEIGPLTSDVRDVDRKLKRLAL